MVGPQTLKVNECFLVLHTGARLAHAPADLAHHRVQASPIRPVPELLEENE